MKLSFLVLIFFFFSKYLFYNKNVKKKGNLLKNDSLKISSLVDQILYSSSTDTPSSECSPSPLNFAPLSSPLQITKLTEKSYLYSAKCFNEKEKNFCASVYLQIGDFLSDHKFCANLMLFEQIVKSDFFAQIRTKQQLGYIVFSRMQVNSSVLGFRFIVQSSVATPDYLDQQIEKWIEVIL